MYSLSVGLIIGSSELAQEVGQVLGQLPLRLVLDQKQLGDWTEFLQKLERANPDIVVLDQAALADPLDQAVRQIKSAPGKPLVIVVHGSADPETILTAVRAGADEFVYSPVEPYLHKAIERVVNERVKTRAGTAPRGKVFGFVSAKGGCGATTLACHIAIELQRATNLEVLLADLDLEGGVIGFLMKSKCRYSIADAVDNSHRLDLSFWKALVSNGFPGVEVIMAPPPTIRQKERQPDDFRNVLRFVRSNYDWTLLDLGSGLSQPVLAVLEEVDNLYLVTTLDIPALHQAKKFAEALAEAGYNRDRIKVILNRVPKRSEVTLDELERMLGVPVYASLPSDYVSLYDAYAEGTLLPANSTLGRHFSRIATKIAGLEQYHTKKRFALFS